LLYYAGKKLNRLILRYSQYVGGCLQSIRHRHLFVSVR
jgi:hypothetical protein